MNAIVSLVHFCEADGPSVIFCTQAFHDNAAEDIEECISASNGRSSPVPARTIPEKENGTLSNKKDLPNAARSRPASCASCAFSLPPPDTLGDIKVLNYSEKKGFKTEDDENPLITYVGSRYPQHPQLYSAGPVLFGDDKNGYVLSYMFKIKDSQARGFQRLYTTDLQLKASQIFEKEGATLSPSSPDKDINRAIEFNLENGIDEHTIGIVNVNGSYSPSNLYINQLSEILNLNLPPELMNMRLEMFKEEWSRFIITGTNVDPGADKPVNGLIASNSLKQRELIKCLNVNEIDLPTLKFLSD
ncbi:8400_t:CDS:2, partial [Racocetra fulgida]